MLGKDLKESLEESGLEAVIRTVGSQSDSFLLSESGGEPGVIAALEEGEFHQAAAILLAGPPTSSQRAFDLRARNCPNSFLIDLTHTFEDHPEARVRAPLAEGYDEPGGTERILVTAHPAAAALAFVLRRIHRQAPISSCVVHVFEPASERGQAGLDELQQQTVKLLSFQQLPKDVFDAQLSFNLLPRAGEAAPVQLQAVEDRICRHLASLLAEPPPVPMPSLRLIQAPVFHGYSVSVWVRLVNNFGPAVLEELLQGEGIEIRAGNEEPPTNVGIAGQSGLSVGDIRADANDPHAAWFWLCADNLRWAAANAAELTRLLLAGKNIA